MRFRFLDVGTAHVLLLAQLPIASQPRLLNSAFSRCPSETDECADVDRLMKHVMLRNLLPSRFWPWCYETLPWMLYLFTETSFP